LFVCGENPTREILWEPFRKKEINQFWGVILRRKVAESGLESSAEGGPLLPSHSIHRYDGAIGSLVSVIDVVTDIGSVKLFVRLFQPISMANFLLCRKDILFIFPLYAIDPTKLDPGG
jgi:hypothetical protein